MSWFETQCSCLMKEITVKYNNSVLPIWYHEWLTILQERVRICVRIVLGSGSEFDRVRVRVRVRVTVRVRVR